MSNRDYSSSTYTKYMRNRIIAAGFKANPGSLLTQDVSLQAISGSKPVYTLSTDGSTENVLIPCGCNSDPVLFGAEPYKDMDITSYTEVFDPYNYQNDFFSGMADFIDENIVEGDKDPSSRLIASYWDDLGNDVFDTWGFFYLYDPVSGTYYFPLFNPQNLDDGIMTTQIFNVFGRTFTIIHGWAAQGIFKIDISVADSATFIFGAYGNMGFDDHGTTENLSRNYSFGTLYYHHTQDNHGLPDEQLYMYVIPKTSSENQSRPFSVTYQNEDNMSMRTNELTSGVLIYFSKSNDTRRWVADDVITTL